MQPISSPGQRVGKRGGDPGNEVIQRDVLNCACELNYAEHGAFIDKEFLYSRRARWNSRDVWCEEPCHGQEMAPVFGGGC